MNQANKGPGNWTRFSVTTAVLAVVWTIFWVGDLFTGLEFKLNKVWLYTSLAYLTFSWRWSEQVQAGFLAVLQRFGRNVGFLEPGLHFAPLGIYELRMVNTQLQQKEYPGEPQNVWQGDPDQTPAGKVPALRVNFRDAITEDQAIKIFGNDYTLPDGTTFQAETPIDGLARRVTTPVMVVVEFQVFDAETYISRFRSDEDLIRILEDEAFRVIKVKLPNMSVGQAMANMAWINAHIMASINSRIVRDLSTDSAGARNREAGTQTNPWGVRIVAAYLKDIRVHHALNSAISAASEAEFTGRAEKELLIQKGEGAAVAAGRLEEETLAGKGRGLKKAAKATGMTPAEIQAADVARSVGEKGNAVVVGAEGFGQLAGIVASITKDKEK